MSAGNAKLINQSENEETITAGLKSGFTVSRFSMDIEG
jgi:hypothetical protein